jgi:L-lactate dehydrogenase (cytochrome)
MQSPSSKTIRPRPLRSGAQRFADVADTRAIAQRRLPRMVFDYIDGAAGRETAAKANLAGLDALRLLPRVLQPSDGAKLATDFLGQTLAQPWGIAPMGLCNLAWPGADTILARAASQRGMPLGVSTAASTDLETLHRLSAGNAWFQLYVTGGTEAALALADRAAQAGYRHLILTVDVPKVAPRPRDVRNGFAMPLRLGPAQVWDFAMHPAWSLSTLWAGVPRTANFSGQAAFDRYASRAGANWEFLDRLRAHWKGQLIVKGVLRPQDAVRIRDAGADAVYVSNHGGRQLDSAPAAIDQLAQIRAAVGGNFPLVFDSGIRSGEDVVKALACGANLVMLGRAALYAIAAGGAQALDQYLDAVQESALTALVQLGVRSPAELGPPLFVQTPTHTPQHQERL